MLVNDAYLARPRINLRVRQATLEVSSTVPVIYPVKENLPGATRRDDAFTHAV